jgi:hypothetical protein
MRRWRLVVIAWTIGSAGCTGTPAPRTTTPAPPATSPAPATSDHGLPPAGYGTLKQEDVALRLNRLALQIRVLPLDESVIRLLAPDAYRSLAELKRSKHEALESVARRTGSGAVSVWYVQFFSSDPGEAQFTPTDLQITNVGRDFRPLDVLPLNAGFSDHRVSQRETVSALFVYDGQVDVAQPLVIDYEGTTNGDWTALLSRLERERAAVRARARGPS